MNILIVDDLLENREILQRVIAQYAKTSIDPCHVFEAQNGEVALEKCHEASMDIIFMDIVMPIMGGLEATQKIKVLYPKSLVVVLSSQSDEDTKCELMTAGAEDYIVKPFSASVLFSRLKNYQELIHARNSIGFQVRAVNLFTKNIYSYQMTFFIEKSDDLAQFWETILLRHKFQNHMSRLSDYMRFLFRLGRYLVKRSFSFHIIVEEDVNNFYFSMDGMQFISKDAIVSALEKHCPNGNYRLDTHIFSFAIARTGSSTQNSVQSIAINSPIERLQTFDILDESSVAELEHQLMKLKTEISFMGSSSLDLDDVDLMKSYFMEVAQILNYAEDSYIISNAIKSLVELLETYAQEFLEKSQELSVMMSSFINDLLMWKEMIFYSGAPSVDFLNKSLSSSVEMIKALFVTTQVNNEDLDDIFDF